MGTRLDPSAALFFFPAPLMDNGPEQQGLEPVGQLQEQLR